MNVQRALDVSNFIIKGIFMTLQDALKLWPVIMVGVSVIVTGTASQFQISQNKDDIVENSKVIASEIGKVEGKLDAIQSNREMIIRVEESNKNIGDDIEEIKKLLKEMAK